MKKALIYIKDTFFGNRLSFRVRLFNVLATAGVMISLLSSIICLFNGEGIVTSLSNLTTTFIAFGLMVYASRSGNYQLCYMLTIILVFLIALPAIFFIGGGYSGAMPYYFIFAVTFTVFMLEGKRAVIMSAAELIVYVGICVYGYCYPETVKQIEGSLAILVDRIIGFVSVSAALGITMFLHFRLYNRQQRELEAAREEAEASREEALKFSDAKSRFLANMSHEIRTPINVMLGKNELIMRESDSDQVRAYSRSVRSAGDTLLTLVSNVLDMSKIEQGRLSATSEDYEILDLVEELAEIGEGCASRRGLSFRVAIDAGLPRTLFGDILLIKQVASNFLDNAVKYTEEGEVVLSIFPERGPAEDEILLCISVKDTGTGIKEEDMPGLFGAFIRGRDPGIQHIQGTGLGLAISKELTEIMGGRIFGESKWGEGSVFTVKIPQRVVDASSWGRRAENAAGGASRDASFIAPGGVVLVVDDNLENLQVISLMLSRMLLRVDTAESGAECLKAVWSRHYDVILMDYMMPGMDGEETMRRLREIPGFGVPTVALTANIVAGTKERLLAAGFAKYLPKPVMWRDLELTLLDMLPERLVIPHSGERTDIVDEGTKKRLTAGLAPFGVDLNAGLRYLSGDIFQYARLTAFFTANYGPEERKLTELFENGDWENLRYIAHALKSKAKGIGAAELSETAAKFERICSWGGEGTPLLLPMLRFEWSRAVMGLETFISEMKKIVPTPAAGGKNGESSATLDELLGILRHNRRPDAIKMLDGLIGEGPRPEVLAVLREARDKVREREMRAAEGLVLALTEAGSYGQ